MFKVIAGLIIVIGIAITAVVLYRNNRKKIEKAVGKVEQVVDVAKDTAKKVEDTIKN